jgi:ribosome biogenesis GTPase
MIDVRLRGKLKLLDKKVTNPIAVGDWVELEQVTDEDYVIRQVVDRDNYVIRVSPRKKSHFHIIAANIDQAVLIGSLKQPKTSIGFIDRFFITLETFRIPGILVINKTDLYSEQELKALAFTKELYESIGYQVLFASFEHGDTGGIEELLKDKTTLLSGHSGTGKSTLINQLVPEAEQSVSEVSNFADKGVHTTTFAEMFDLPKGGTVIDTPGIKELGLAEIEETELSHYFPEMRQFLGECKFNNCLHLDEPGCIIRAAVDEGAIHLSRYQSYLSMLEDDDNRR